MLPRIFLPADQPVRKLRQHDLTQMHKTLADPAVNLSRSFKLVRVLGGAGGREKV